MNVLKLIGTLFKLTISICDAPAGKKLGTLDLPGALWHFINIELRIAGIKVLAGHIQLI